MNSSCWVPMAQNCKRDDPDGLRLLLVHARREPDFAEYADAVGAVLEWLYRSWVTPPS